MREKQNNSQTDCGCTTLKKFIIIYARIYFFVMAFFQNKIVQILIFSLLPMIGAFIVSFSTMGAMYPWYKEINRPSWNPPDWVSVI
jgi:hypothetical protein